MKSKKYNVDGFLVSEGPDGKYTLHKADGTTEPWTDTYIVATNGMTMSENDWERAINKRRKKDQPSSS